MVFRPLPPILETKSMRASLYDTANKLTVSTVPCSVLRVQGYYTAAADAWLQIFDSVAEPAENAVPVKSYALASNSPYSWAFDPGTLCLQKGCYVAVSETQGTYTAVAFEANVTMLTLLADYGVNDFRDSGFSTGGDQTTGVDELDVWADAAAAANNRLLHIDYHNKLETDGYLLLFAHDPSEGDKPLHAWLAESEQVLALDFGSDGLVVVSDENLDETSGTKHYGCFLRQSTDPEELAATSSTVSYIRAYFTT